MDRSTIDIVTSGINITKKEDLEYIKSLNLDPDFDKIDVNSGEDLISQLAKIKNIDKDELKERLAQTMIMLYLSTKNYNNLKQFLQDPNISVKEKREAFDMKYSPSGIRKIFLPFIMVFYIIFFVTLYVLFVPYLVSLIISLLFIPLSIFSQTFKTEYSRLIVKLYFKYLGWKEVQ